MRTRSNLSDPIVIPSSHKWRTRRGSGPWSSYTLAEGNWFTQDQQVMTDQKTPGYFKAVREGTAIPTSPMSSTKISTMISPMAGTVVSSRVSGGVPTYYEITLDGLFTNPDGGTDTTWAAKPQVVTPDGGIALQEALSRAQSDAYDALTFAAEFRKTVEGVVTLRSRAMTIFDRLVSAVTSKRKKRRYSAMEISQIAAEVWLEMRYLWRPLVYDMLAMQEAVRRLQEGIEDPLQRAYATRSGGESQNSVVKDTTNFVLPSLTQGLPSLRHTLVQTCVAERTVHASVGLKVTTRDITMIDPFVTGWELVPFSFVLDWFITIGDALTAFSPFATGQLQYATLSTKTVYTFRTVSSARPLSNWVTESNSMNPGTAIRIEEVYERVNATPAPTVAIDINLSVSKIVDLVALWGSINRKSLTRLLRHF